MTILKALVDNKIETCKKLISECKDKEKEEQLKKVMEYLESLRHEYSSF